MNYLCLFFLFSFAILGTHATEDVYVNPLTGSGTACTEASPCADIATALGQVDDGGTVNLATNADYAGTRNVGLSLTSSLTIMQWSTVVNSTNITSSMPTISLSADTPYFVQTSYNLNLSGLQIQAPDYTSPSLVAISVSASSIVSITACTFENIYPSSSTSTFSVLSTTNNSSPELTLDSVVFKNVSSSWTISPDEMKFSVSTSVEIVQCSTDSTLVIPVCSTVSSVQLEGLTISDSQLSTIADISGCSLMLPSISITNNTFLHHALITDNSYVTLSDSTISNNAFVGNSSSVSFISVDWLNTTLFDTFTITNTDFTHNTGLALIAGDLGVQTRMAATNLTISYNELVINKTTSNPSNLVLGLIDIEDPFTLNFSGFTASHNSILPSGASGFVFRCRIGGNLTATVTGMTATYNSLISMLFEGTSAQADADVTILNSNVEHNNSPQTTLAFYLNSGWMNSTLQNIDFANNTIGSPTDSNIAGESSLVYCKSNDATLILTLVDPLTFTSNDIDGEIDNNDCLLDCGADNSSLCSNIDKTVIYIVLGVVGGIMIIALVVVAAYVIYKKKTAKKQDYLEIVDGDAEEAH